MRPKRLQLLTILLLLALCGLDGWAYLVFSQSKQQAISAQQESTYCQQLAQQIKTLRTRPAIAGSQEQAQDELSARIETAVRAAGLGRDDIASIAPSPPARVDDSAYLEKSTTVQLRQATMPQLMELFVRLTAAGSRLQIKALRLSAPREKSDTQNWGVELTVTYLIYSPVRPSGQSQLATYGD